MKIQHRTFNIILIVLAVLFLAVVGYLIFQRYHQSMSVPLAAVTPVSPDAQAAMAGVSAFYTIDYTESAEDWTKRVCETTTTNGCQIAQAFNAAAVHATAVKYSVKTSCSALPISLVNDDETNMVRVWRVQATLSNPWPTIKSTFTAYVAVEFDKQLQQWRMQHVLFDQEAKKYESVP